MADEKSGEIGLSSKTIEENNTETKMWETIWLPNMERP